MLNSAMNEWAIKAIQLETALMALEEVGLPMTMKPLREKAEQALRELVVGWRSQKPPADERQWKQEPAKAQGKPQDEELAEVTTQLTEDELEWTVHRFTSDKGDTVETILSGDRAWMSAGGEYYAGQWDEERQLVEVGRDDEEGELGTGLILTLKGELVYEPQLDN
jgi:hypothetical protein